MQPAIQGAPAPDHRARLVRRALKQLEDDPSIRLCLMDVLGHFGTARRKTTQQLIERAQEEYESSLNDIEIERAGVLSEAEKGTWVLAWVWLANEDDAEREA